MGEEGGVTAITTVIDHINIFHSATETTDTKGAMKVSEWEMWPSDIRDAS